MYKAVHVVFGDGIGYPGSALDIDVLKAEVPGMTLSD